ncbi:MAG: translation initiation factor [Cyanobacteria bacterium J06623_7]
MAGKRKSKHNSMAYQEFGRVENPALERAVADLPPEQQDLRIQATRSGRKGKTVTVVTGLQHNSESLSRLLKKLKSQCGSGGTIKNNNLEIQGDHKQKLWETLTKMGYQAKISGG